MKTSTYQAAVFAAAYAVAGAGAGCCGRLPYRPAEIEPSGRDVVISEHTLRERVLPSGKHELIKQGRTKMRVEFGDPLSLDYENGTVRVPLHYWKTSDIKERVDGEAEVEQMVIDEAHLLPAVNYVEERGKYVPELHSYLTPSEVQERIKGWLQQMGKAAPHRLETIPYVRKVTRRVDRKVEQSRTAEEQGTEPLVDFIEAGYQLIAMGGCIEEKPRYAPDGSFIEFSLKKGCYTGETENEARKKAEQHLGYSHVKKPCRKLAKEMLKRVKQENGGLELCLLKKGDDDCTAERKREEGYRFPMFEFPDAGYNERFIAEILRQKFETRFGEVQINFYLRRRNPAMNVDIDVRRVEIKPKKVPTPEQLAAICFEDGSNPFNTARDMLAGWYEFWDKEEPAEYDDNDTIEASVFLPSTVDMMIDVGFGWPKVKKTVTFRKKEELMKFFFKER